MTAAALDNSVDAPAPASPPVAAERDATHAPRHLWALLAITLLGVALRFVFPDRPLLWGDDAYTVYRTHADYQSMLDVLQYDGFTPLHYELYWLLGKSTRLEPVALRYLPAVFGSLMVPAMYLLASHLVRRRTALVVALFTACSAYLLGYSRDMKMYIMLWSFSAWSAACLLWWFRTGRRVAWLAWVAATLAMTSSHMTGMALLPFEAIFFLTRSKVRWQESILFAVGIAIAAAGPAAYITQFNTWAQQEVEDFGFEVEGLGWVVEYNQGRDGPDLFRYGTSAYLLSWEWPKVSGEGKIEPWVLTSLKGAVWVLLGLAAVGAMPWSRRLRGIRPGEVSPQPWWRVVLWLGLWLVVPAYFMYCRSVTDFESPATWWRDVGTTLGGAAWVRPDGALSHWLWVVLGGAALVVAVPVFLSARFRRAMVWVAPGAAGVALIVALFRSGLPPEQIEGTGWVQYVFKPLNVWAEQMTEPLVLAGLAVLLPGLILYYCGTGWVDRIKRVVQFVIVGGTILLACHLVYAGAEAKLQKEIAQVTSYRPTGDAQRDARALAQVKASLEAPGRAWQSIFMPRYIGFVWLPFAIGLCALYMRLPTRGLRIVAVGLLVAVNLAQFGGRLLAGTEPPLDWVARDVWRHDVGHNPAADRAGRVYVNDTPVSGPGHPGYGTLQGQQGKYYLGLERGSWFHPREWKGVRSAQHFDIRSPQRGGRGLLDYGTIAADVKRSPGVRRVIVWEKYFREGDEKTEPLLPLLGEGWEKVGQWDYRVRLHWNWTDLYLYRRVEYVKG